jgi:hypothetical protein
VGAERAVIITLAAGVVPAFVLAWIYDFTSGGLVRTADRDGSGPGSRRPPVAGEVGSRARRLRPAVEAMAPAPAPPPAPAQPGKSIAILPFADLSQARDQDWFCVRARGGDHRRALPACRGLRVASRTASFRYPRRLGRPARDRRA